MSGLLYVFVPALLLITFWIALHIRPLKDGEVTALAQKRRSKAVAKYFAYQRHEVPVNKAFKKRMDAKGRMYQTTESLANFPAVAASLLKYKKHEWVILAFEAQGIVRRFWVNKGIDRNSVSILLGISEILHVCREHQATSVLFFHNHPNSDPAHYTTAIPSKVDEDLSRGWSDSLVSKGVSLLSFVCERGTAHEYHRSISSELMPVTDFSRRISEVNGLSRSGNLRLHFARMF